MASQTADDFMTGLLGDEGWQSALEGASIESLIAGLETLLPADTTVTAERGDQIRQALRTLAAQVAAERGAEPALVAACLKGLHA